MMILLYNLQIELENYFQQSQSLCRYMRITSMSLLFINRYVDCIKRNAVSWILNNRNIPLRIFWNTSLDRLSFEVIWVIKSSESVNLSLWVGVSRPSCVIRRDLTHSSQEPLCQSIKFDMLYLLEKGARP